MTRHTPDKTRIEVILPPDLLAKLDQQRGLATRAEYIRELIRRSPPRPHR